MSRALLTSNTALPTGRALLGVSRIAGRCLTFLFFFSPSVLPCLRRFSFPVHLSGTSLSCFSWPLERGITTIIRAKGANQLQLMAASHSEASLLSALNMQQTPPIKLNLSAPCIMLPQNPPMPQLSPDPPISIGRARRCVERLMR